MARRPSSLWVGSIILRNNGPEVSAGKRLRYIEIIFDRMENFDRRKKNWRR